MHVVVSFLNCFFYFLLYLDSLCGGENGQLVQRFSGWWSNSKFKVSRMCTLTGLWTNHVAANSKCAILYIHIWKSWSSKNVKSGRPATWLVHRLVYAMYWTWNWTTNLNLCTCSSSTSSSIYNAGLALQWSNFIQNITYWSTREHLVGAWHWLTNLKEKFYCDMDEIYSEIWILILHYIHCMGMGNSLPWHHWW